MKFKLGIFVVPDATNAAATVAQIIEAERSGLDVVGVQDAGRDPTEIDRALNVMALEGRPATWVEQLAGISEDLHISTLLVGVPQEDPVTFVRRLGEDVGPRLRELLQ